ncbi:MAG: hypothetical protein RLZZ519_1688 [Bacteroidota bacterium]|jgi:hypothetical protein
MFKSTLLFALLFVATIRLMAQTVVRRPLSELIDKNKSGWTTVQKWLATAKNDFKVLPRDSKRAENALYETQVTTKSPMGAIVYETGGILIDHGWIRILGSGSKKLDRELMTWNEGKSFQKGEVPSGWLLIADDVLGGFFAINNGGISTDEIGKIFYFVPQLLQWEPMNLSYSEFIQWCLNCDMATFYQGARWVDWEKEIAKINGDQGIHCFPPLFSVEGQDINKTVRKAVPIQELWDYGQSAAQQLNPENDRQGK